MSAHCGSSSDRRRWTRRRAGHAHRRSTSGPAARRRRHVAACPDRPRSAVRLRRSHTRCPRAPCHRSRARTACRPMPGIADRVSAPVVVVVVESSSVAAMATASSSCRRRRRRSRARSASKSVVRPWLRSRTWPIPRSLQLRRKSSYNELRGLSSFAGGLMRPARPALSAAKRMPSCQMQDVSR